ncbi:MAG: ribosome recycling factor [Oscillospiraceae bacterium]|jgi:ribosome recycling factor|nr:ribosome recycling factor [Oscillospiraceae bacterium]
MKATLKAAEDKMQKSVASLENNFASIRAGRATPAVLDKIMVDYYGTPTAIQSMAAISVAEARVLVIQPWDKTSLKSIEKAILASDLGITPMNDGNVIRLSFPQPTEERRKELCKTVKKYGEEAKVSVRNVRRDTLDKFKAMKKNGDLTEDDQKDAEKKLQKITDKYCEDVEKAVSEKEKEIMSI